MIISILLSNYLIILFLKHLYWLNLSAKPRGENKKWPQRPNYDFKQKPVVLVFMAIKFITGKIINVLKFYLPKN